MWTATVCSSCARLEHDGIPCWIAPQAIPVGRDYSSEIPEAIANCSAFLLLLSADSQRSIWVPKELDTAINHGKPIVPYFLDDAPLTASFSFKLVNVQCIPNSGKPEESYNILRETLLRTLPAAATQSAPAPQPIAPTARQNKWPTTARYVMPLLALLVVFLIAYAAGRMGPAPVSDAAASNQVSFTATPSPTPAATPVANSFYVTGPKIQAAAISPSIPTSAPEQALTQALPPESPAASSDASACHNATIPLVQETATAEPAPTQPIPQAVPSASPPPSTLPY